MNRAPSSGPAATVDTERRPFVLIWEVTQACELACKHCRADATPDRHPAELSTKEAKALLDDIADFGNDQLLVLSGGDPLARPDLFELIEYGVDRGLRMTLTPSGTGSLTPDVVTELTDLGVRRLALSFDGPTAESHDGFRGESGSFASTMRAARAASECGLPLQINTTVCRETAEGLPELIELVDDLDAVLWSVFFLVPVGRGGTLAEVTPPQAERIMEWLLDQGAEREFGIKTTEAPHYRRVAIQRASEGAATSAPASDAIGRRSGIGAGDGFAFISHTGEVYPSGFLPLSGGDVRNRSIVDIYRQAPLFTELRDRDNLVGKCGACEFRGLCGGSRSRVYARTGSAYESDPLCPYVPATVDAEK